MTHFAALQHLDADVHVRWPSDETIAARLPKSWQHRWSRGAGHTQPGLRIQHKFYNPLDSHAGSPVRTASQRAADDPAKLIADWMEPHQLDAAVLSVYDAPLLSTFGDVDYPIIVARAVNEWLAECWLETDARFLGTIVVATQDPLAAAAEIRRAARHPRMVQVMLPTGTQMPYGHRRYFPIYEAAVECGLAVAIHSGTEGMGTSVSPTPCGWPGTLMELQITRSTAFLGHLTSLITEGVFVQFPELKIIGLETGIAWLPTYLWRFDKNYKGLRSECPWLKELPSEYVRRFFRFGTQGAEPGPHAHFWRLLKSTGLDDALMFSSNYPRWDYDTPENSHVLAACPEEKRAAIRGATAAKTYPRLN